MEINRVLLVLFTVFLLDYLPREAGTSSRSHREISDWFNITFANFGEAFDYYRYTGFTPNHILQLLTTGRILVNPSRLQQIESHEELRRFPSIREAVRILESEGHTVHQILRIMSTAIYVNRPLPAVYIRVNNRVRRHRNRQSSGSSRSRVSTNQEHGGTSREHESVPEAGTSSHTSSNRGRENVEFLGHGFIPGEISTNIPKETYHQLLNVKEISEYILLHNANREAVHELCNFTSHHTRVTGQSDQIVGRITNSNLSDFMDRIRDPRTHEIGPEEEELRNALRGFRITNNANAPTSGATTARLSNNRNFRNLLSRLGRRRHRNDD